MPLLVLPLPPQATCSGHRTGASLTAAAVLAFSCARRLPSCQLHRIFSLLVPFLLCSPGQLLVTAPYYVLGRIQTPMSFSP
jgi:hypothetical protein